MDGVPENWEQEALQGEGEGGGAHDVEVDQVEQALRRLASAEGAQGEWMAEDADRMMGLVLHVWQAVNPGAEKAAGVALLGPWWEGCLREAALAGSGAALENLAVQAAAREGAPGGAGQLQALTAWLTERTGTGAPMWGLGTVLQWMQAVEADRRELWVSALMDGLPVVLLAAAQAWEAGRVAEREADHRQHGANITVAWMMGAVRDALGGEGGAESEAERLGRMEQALALLGARAGAV
eukprot:5580883-Prymnesium_polylepis.1